MAPLVVEQQGAVATLCLSRPERLNALNQELKTELGAAIAALNQDPTVRAVVLTGEGRGFCAGSDLADLTGETGAAYRSYLQRLQREVTLAIWESPKPWVAAVNGVAAGAGTSLAMVCDIAIAVPEAGFAFSWVHGPALVPDLGAAHLLVRLVGLARARQWLLTSARVGAGEALAAGLIAEVVPAAELAGAALRIATRLAEGAPLALAGARELLRAGLNQGLADNLTLEADLQALVRLSDDHREAVQAFREKRPPRFCGR